MELTDDAILETADQLVKELALTGGDDRDVIVLAIQRLIWPPSPLSFLHEDEHVVRVIVQRGDGRWDGELRCPHGCSRRWSVNAGPGEEAVYNALAAAHEEYRTGRVTAVPPPGSGRRVSLDTLLSRVEYVEVQDERLTAAWTEPS